MPSSISLEPRAAFCSGIQSWFFAIVGWNVVALQMAKACAAEMAPDLAGTTQPPSQYGAVLLPW